MKGDSWTVNFCSWGISLFYAWLTLSSVAFWSTAGLIVQINGMFSFLALKGTGTCLCGMHYLSKFRPRIKLLHLWELQVTTGFQPAPSKMFLVSLWSYSAQMPRGTKTSWQKPSSSASQNIFSWASVGLELGFLGWSFHHLVPVIESAIQKCSALMILATTFIVMFSSKSKDLMCFRLMKEQPQMCLFLSRGCSNIKSPFSMYAPNNTGNDKMFCGTGKCSFHIHILDRFWSFQIRFWGK